MEVLLTVLATLSLGIYSSTAPKDISFSQSASVVDAYDFIEITLNVEEPNVKNPFTDVFVEGYFERVEDGIRVDVDGFCDSMDGSTFRIRFMPTSVGEYFYSVTYFQGEYEKTHTGTFRAVDGKRRGILRVAPENRWHFVWEGSKEQYFWNGTTTYYLMGWQDEDIIRKAIERLHSLKINRLRVLVYGRNKPRPWGMPVVPTENFKLWLNPWVAERPDDIENPGFDLTRFNVEYWQKYERMLRYAREKDMIISVIFFIGGQILPTPFAEGSEDEHRYYRYGVARLAAFSNVTWDLGNEHNFHREVPEWADKLGHLVKKWDAYEHLTSAHNLVYRTPKSTWIDMQLIQRWDLGQNSFLLQQRQQQEKTGHIIPQVLEEYGYQDLWEKYPGQREADTRRRVAWEVYMSGCYQTTGETAERGTGVPPDTGGGWVNGRGDDTMDMLESYEHIVNFFKSFEWWKTNPRNDLVNNGALCLAQPGGLYVVYLPTGGNVTVKLEKGNYQANWFDPRTGNYLSLPEANSPIWTSPNTPDEEDWVLLLKNEPSLSDTTPPIISSVSAGGDGKSIYVVFSELVEQESATNLSNYTIDNNVNIKSISLGGEDDKTAILTTFQLQEGTTYTITVNNVKDGASPANAIMPDSQEEFTFISVLNPIVELSFNENTGRKTVNTGTSSESHPTARITDDKPTWTTNVPPNGGTSALDFGTEVGEYAVDLSGGQVNSLKGLKSFTITGWLNCRNAEAGSGGNRIVTTINNGNDGFDLVFLSDGSLQIGINEWPDGSPARSFPGMIPVEPNADISNWRFFAVTYDSTADSEHVKFYFGKPSEDAKPDRTISYDRGQVGFSIGPSLTVGHFNLATRSKNTADRVFRGLIDEIRIYGSSTDNTGTLSLNQIIDIQKGKVH